MKLSQRLVFVGIISFLSSPYFSHNINAAEHDHNQHKMEAMDKHSEHNNSPAKDEHAMHRATMDKSGYSVTTENYEIPDVKVIDQSGEVMKLSSIVNSDKPIALNFIFTTCTTICPVMTSTFSKMRQHLGKEGDEVHFVSITVDPEYDRPEVLKEYAENFRVGSNWAFLTGDSVIILKVIRSFNAYFGSKMNHRPLTLLKKPGSLSWTRIEGLASGSELAKEVKTRLLK